MQPQWWEGPVRFLDRFWWVLLLLVVLSLTAYFTRDTWGPAVGWVPTPVPQPTLVLGTGDVQITLSWSSTNDLDLWVTDPAGTRIFYDNKSSSTGGVLDVDANPGCQRLTNQPVENIFWPQGEAPTGEFVVEVYYYQQCEETSAAEYQVRILVDGRVEEIAGTITTVNEKHTVITFQR